MKWIKEGLHTMFGIVVFVLCFVLFSVFVVAVLVLLTSIPYDNPMVVKFASVVLLVLKFLLGIIFIPMILIVANVTSHELFEWIYKINTPKDEYYCTYCKTRHKGKPYYDFDKYNYCEKYFEDDESEE